MKPKCSGITHAHSYYSIKDSVARVKDLFQRAKELGAPAFALTDHGVLTGVEEAKTVAKEIGIKFIPGVEAYFEENDASVIRRMHLILLAKDIVGYHAISLAVTKSNANLDSRGFPCMNMDIIKEFFGESSVGHGHVIATSACMNGILCSMLRINDSVNSEIEKLQNKKIELYKPNEVYTNQKKRSAEIDVELASIAEKLNKLDKTSKRSFIKKEKTLKSFEGKEEYANLKKEFDLEVAEVEMAKKEISKLKELRTKLKLEQKSANDFCKPFDDDKVKLEAIENKIVSLQNSLLSDEELYAKAKDTAIEFVNIFGNGNFYCEIQYHGIDIEKETMPVVVQIAKELNIPLVAANDAHMVDGSKDSIKARQIVRSLRFNKWEKLFAGDDELYIKTDEELSSKLLEIFPKDVVDEAIAGISDIVSACNVEFKSEHHYPKFKSEIEGENAVDRLNRLSREGIKWRYPNLEGWTEEHQKRMEYELNIITKLGFCDYLCIVEDFLRYGRLLGKIDLNNPKYLADPYNLSLLEELSKDNVGLGIGPGRGSAVGSLVCYLIGITGIDPMKYDLIFERFLNEERVTMPDIDSDFKSDIRDKALDYVKYKYGKDAVCCIMTKGTQVAKGSIRNCARLLGSEKFNDPKRFLSLGDQMSKLVGNEIGVTLNDVEEKIKDVFGNDEYAMEILHNAKLVEGSFVNVGMHAAGVIIADNGDVKQYVPLMYNSEKGEWMTQCEMGQCEALGLLKMDFLGLRNLGIITETLKEIKKNTGKSIDIEKVPFEKDVFTKIFASGNTNSIFQFESGGMKKMLRQFKPESIEDVILLVAAYRPGPMQYLDNIIAVKHGRKKPEYVIPEMKTILGKTYGYPVYQEQIMQIFNKFAGFSLGESDIIRRYMSKKKTDKFIAYKDKFIDGLCSNGAKKNKAEEFWNQLVDFSKYAFNKSHATAYAFVAYYTAWLKHYYPKEYLCSVMNDTLMTKIGGLIADGKSVGLKFYPADINKSVEKFSTTDDGILAGLSLIKNVSSSAAPIIKERCNGSYKSFNDFMLRTNCQKNVAENLIYAGAFDKFTKNRKALVDAVPEYCELLKKIKQKEAVINETIDTNDENEINKLEARKERAKIARENLINNLNNISVNIYGEENFLERLEQEKEKIGAFISGHPLDLYGNPKDFGCTVISDIEPKNNINVMGIVTNLRITKRKSDGKELAFFTLEDQTGSVDINCFTKTYAEFKKFIREDNVIIINGECIEDVDNITDETVYKINAKSMKSVEIKKKKIIIEIKSPMDWEDTIKQTIRQFRDKSGMELVCYDLMNCKFRNTGIYVSNDILSVKSLKPRIV